MTKALITCAADPREGAWYDIFRLAESTFIPYAAKWGYDYKAMWYGDLDLARWPRLDIGFEEWKKNPVEQAKHSRDNRDGVRTSPMYLKEPMIIETLEEYDAVLFLDADCLILDDSKDILDALPTGKDFGMYHSCDAMHPDGGPITAVWLTRKTETAMRFLHAAWDSESWRGCIWNDVCAVYDLLGYEYKYRVAVKVRDTEYTPFYHRFGEDWIGDGFGNQGAPQPGNRIFHVSYGKGSWWKLATMQRIMQGRGL